MPQKLFSSFLVLALSIFLLPIGIWARMGSTNYIIWADVFSSGGNEDSSSANYTMQDTIGEAIILSATSTSANYGIKAGFREMYADQYITLAITDTAVDLGILSASGVKTDSHDMTVDTNANNGFTVTVTGATLASGANTITAIGSTALASAVGTEQFGINLVANTSPAVGANPSGTAPIGFAADQYNAADFFAFNSGDAVATSTIPINQTAFTVSYIANITATTEAGTYTTTLTYSATANF